MAGRAVRCASCSTVVRTPNRDDGIPFAQVAEVVSDAEAIAAVEAASMLLGYAEPSTPLNPGGGGRGDAEPPETVAERLGRVVLAAEGDDGTGAMTECPYCGSTIASFVRKCPFCRHPLYGPA